MNYKAVTLDFWDTIVLYPFTEEIFLERVEHASKMFEEYDISYETSKMLMRSIYEHFEDVWHNESRTPTTPESFQFVEKLIGYEFEKNHFDELVKFNEQLIIKKYFDIPSEITETIIELSKKYKLIIISDTGFEPGIEIRKALKKHNLLHCFQYCVFSDETGFSKPDKRAFLKAVEMAGCDFSEMIHIGDREGKDIKGAKSVGMSAVLFTGFRDNDKSDTTADHIATSWDEIRNLLL